MVDMLSLVIVIQSSVIFCSVSTGCLLISPIFYFIGLAVGSLELLLEIGGTIKIFGLK